MINVNDKSQASHHITLSDGQDTVGLIISNVKGDASPTSISASASPRTALKTSTGNTKYSDLEPPWTAIAQSSWANGRGQEDEDDIDRFFDSRRLNTMHDKIMLSPLETYTTGYRYCNYNLPGSVRWVSLLTGDMKYLAVQFTPANNYTATTIYLHVRRRGTPPAALTVELCSDSAGAPDAVLQSTTITTTNITDTEAEFYKCTVTGEALTASTDYWIKAYSTSADERNYWQVGVNDAGGTSGQSSDGATWEVSAVDLYYRITAADVLPAKDIFFQYKQQQFLVRSADSGAPVLYINGDIGVADANTGALTTLVDASKSWVTDEWAGCIVILIGGVGSNESVNWRTVVSNTDTTLTLDSAWKIEHTTATEYVITNSNKWTVISGHGLTAPVTDVLVVNNNLYFAQGDSTNIRRAEWYNNAGTATWRYADDGTNKAEHLCTVRDATDGLEVWKSNTLNAASLKSVASAAAATTWANMTFGTAITFLDDNGKINDIMEYGATKLPWVMREGTVFSILNDVPNEIPLKEMRATMSSRNGTATLVHNIYLYFNLGAGLERYYDGDLLDMGPNRDSGLPSNRQGIVNHMIGYPGRFFACVDGSTANYSSLLGYNLLGWHEIYRAPAVGLRINHGQFQTINGTEPDRLWLSVGQDIIWLAFPSLTVDPSKDTNYEYHHEGSVISSWIYDGLFDVTKLFNSLKLFVENVTDSGICVEADYQVDDDTTWTPLDEAFDTVPMKEIKFSENSITGKRLRYRLRLMTDNKTISPIVKTTVVEAISRVPIKYSYAFSYRITDTKRDLNGNAEPLTAEEQYKLIDGWARNLAKLKMRSTYKRYDDIDVFIDAPPNNPIGEFTEGYLDRMTLTEI